MRFIVLFFALAGLFTSPVEAGENQLDLNALAKILQESGSVLGKPTPKGLLSKRGSFEKGEYDPNKLLALFPQLRMEQGRTLDFVYDLQDLGGHPIVYARSGSAAPFSSLAEFKKDYPRRYFLGDKVRFDPAYLGSIKAEDSPDGFLQRKSYSVCLHHSQK